MLLNTSGHVYVHYRFITCFINMLSEGTLSMNMLLNTYLDMYMSIIDPMFHKYAVGRNFKHEYVTKHISGHTYVHGAKSHH